MGRPLGSTGFSPFELADMEDSTLRWETFWLWNETFRRWSSQRVDADEVCMLTLQNAKSIRYPVVCGMHIFDALALREWILHCRRNGTRESVVPDVPLGTVRPAVCSDRVRGAICAVRCACMLVRRLLTVLLFMWLACSGGASRGFRGLFERRSVEKMGIDQEQEQEQEQEDKEGAAGTIAKRKSPPLPADTMRLATPTTTSEDHVLVLTINESRVVVFSPPSPSPPQPALLTPTGPCSPSPAAASPCTVRRRGGAPPSAPRALSSRRRTAFLPSALPAPPAAAPPPARASSSRPA